MGKIVGLTEGGIEMAIPNFKISVCDEDLEQVIKNNIETANIIRKELIKLKQKATIIQSDYEISEISKSLEKTVLDNTDDDREAEYYYYYSNLKEDYDKASTKEEQKEAVVSNLPSIHNNNYMLIINRIKAEIHKEYLELDSLKTDDESIEFIEEVEQEQKSLIELIEMINVSQTEEIRSIGTESKKENKLVFLDTSSGNVYAQSDLLVMDEEYYEGFKNLLLSIEDGTFKGVKRFKNNDAIKGVSEVRAYKIRVVFDRIDTDKYIIIHMFVKKTNNDRGYREKLINRVNYYQQNKDTIQAMMNDTEYLNQQHNLRDNIMKGLEAKNMVKEMKYHG